MSLTKPFIKMLKDTVLAEPKQMSQLPQDLNVQLNMDVLVNIPNMLLQGYLIKGNCILFISQQKKLFVEAAYIQSINSSQLCQLFNNTNWIIYYLIYQNKNKYIILRYDYSQRKVEIVTKDMNIKSFADIFKNDNMLLSSTARSDVFNLINDIWALLKCGSDQRMVFINLVWFLLSDKSIPFAIINNQALSLSQYFDFIVQKSNMIGQPGWEEMRANLNKQVHQYNSTTLLNAFRNIYMHKLKDTNDDYTKEQMDYLDQTINAMDNEQTKDFGLLVANRIYEKVYKKYSDIDITKLTFELENKYNNRTANTVVASKGQIYTHRMMKELIMEIFAKNIAWRQNQIVTRCYDPTCGTGGFCRSFMKCCEKNNLHNVVIYGNEIDKDCSNMAWIEGLCSKYDVRIFNKDCFDANLIRTIIHDDNIAMDYLLMNPPYGMNKSAIGGLPRNIQWVDGTRDLTKQAPTEWIFCRYNLETYTKQGGWFAFVIPVSCVSENKQNYYDKERLIATCEIWYVIKIREDIFTPQAGKACCLVIGKYVNGLRTSDEIKNWKTKCIDFTNDNGEIKQKKGEVEYNWEELTKLWHSRILDTKDLTGLCQKCNEYLLSVDNRIGESEYYEERVLTPEMNWIYSRRVKIDISEQRGNFYQSIENRRHSFMSTILYQINLSKPIEPENENIEWRDVKITDLFDIMGRGKHSNQDKVNNGKYPLISCTTANNGICGYVNEYEYDGLYITITTDGENAGTCYIQNGKFAVYTNVYVLKPKIEFTDYILSRIVYFMTQRLTTIYNWQNKLNQERLKQETVELPFNKSTNQLDMDVPGVDTKGIEICKDISVSELFEIAPSSKLSQQDLITPGNYPLVSCTTHNNGVKSYVNKYTHDGLYITVATNGDGGAGTCFVQRGKFAAHSMVLILKLREQYTYLEECLNSLAFAMTATFRVKYSHSRVLTQDRLMNEVIHDIPFCPNPQNPNEYIIDVSGLRYIYI